MHVVFENLKLAYTQKRYTILTLVITVLFYAFNALLNNTKAIWFMIREAGLFQGIGLAINLVINYHHTIRGATALVLLLNSIFLGVLFSLIIFKHIFFSNKNEQDRASFLATFGAILGALAPGCALCGVGLFYILGVGGAIITLLPFDGLEFSFLAAAVLLGSIWMLAKNLTYCKLNPKKKR